MKTVGEWRSQTMECVVEAAGVVVTVCLSERGRPVKLLIQLPPELAEYHSDVVELCVNASTVLEASGIRSCVRFLNLHEDLTPPMRGILTAAAEWISSTWCAHCGSEISQIGAGRICTACGETYGVTID